MGLGRLNGIQNLREQAETCHTLLYTPIVERYAPVLTGADLLKSFANMGAICLGPYAIGASNQTTGAGLPVKASQKKASVVFISLCHPALIKWLWEGSP